MLKDRIKESRKAAGLKQREVAELIGVTESTYCGYETGKRQPDVMKLKEIAKVLNVSGDYLLELDIEIAPDISSEAVQIASAFDRADNQSRKHVRMILSEYMSEDSRQVV